MTMWYAVCDKLTGKLKSVGTVITNPLAPENEAIELGEIFDQRAKVWDEKNKQFIDRPDPVLETVVKSRLQALPELSKLTTQEKESFFTKLAILLERGQV